MHRPARWKKGHRAFGVGCRRNGHRVKRVPLLRPAVQPSVGTTWRGKKLQEVHEHGARDRFKRTQVYPLMFINFRTRQPITTATPSVPRIRQNLPNPVPLRASVPLPPSTVEICVACPAGTCCSNAEPNFENSGPRQSCPSRGGQV